jgi:hypothetical protein
MFNYNVHVYIEVIAILDVRWNLFIVPYVITYTEFQFNLLCAIFEKTFLFFSYGDHIPV